MKAAFSLIEVAVAMAMAAIVASAAVGAGMAINRTMTDTRRRAVAWDEAKRLEEALLTQVQEAGGDPIAPHQAIVVEDDCAADGTRGLPACAGADRITLFTITPGTPTCEVDVTGAVLKGDVIAGVCCLTPSGDPTMFENRAAILIPTALGAAPISLNLFNVNGAACQVNAPPGQGNPSPRALTDGTLALVDVRTVFPRKKGADEYELMQWIDVGTPGDGVAQSNELLTIADHVYDFQVALGYDGKPEDGDVVDSSSTTDEWLGNAVGESVIPAAPITVDQLRMIDIALIVGVNADRFVGAPVRLLNRTTAINPPGVYLAPTRGEVGLRNLNVSVP